jgi:pimeloyl-ACP methyl ester carboxylesterase
MTTDWEERTKRRLRILFGRTEKVVWAVMRLILKLFPITIIKALLHDLTILDVDEVIQRMSDDDLQFITRMFQSSRSGTGFLNDIEHHVGNLATIVVPVLVMYSPHDRSVSQRNAQRIADEVSTCELYAVASATHLIWIGNHARAV